MYSKNFLSSYSGKNDDESFENFIRKFVAVCCAEKWDISKWGKRLGYFLDGKMKNKYDKILNVTSDYNIIINELRTYLYKGDFVSNHFNAVHELYQKCHQTVHNFADEVKKKVDIGYVFVTDENQRNIIAVQIFFNGLRKEIKVLLPSDPSASNIEEAEVMALIAMKNTPN